MANKGFFDWLASGSNEPFKAGKGDTFICVERGSGFSFLYHQYAYGDQKIFRNNKFEYCGIYCENDGLIYDAGYALQKFLGNEEELSERSEKKIRARYVAAVRQKVEKRVGNDRTVLPVTEVTDKWLLSRLKDVRNYNAAREARELYLKTSEGVTPDFSYRCDYTPDDWDDERFLNCILDMDGCARAQANAYFQKEGEHILYCFLTNDALKAAYEAILEDTASPVHVIRRIMAAVNSVEAKTVNVTIMKDGTEMTFKTEADGLRRDPSTYYSTYRMAAQDRRRFQEKFGRNADYFPVEITRITYGKNVLYTKEEK